VRMSFYACDAPCSQILCLSTPSDGLAFERMYQSAITAATLAMSLIEHLCYIHVLFTQPWINRRTWLVLGIESDLLKKFGNQ
jgi:hypothetical protein